MPKQPLDMAGSQPRKFSFGYEGADMYQSTAPYSPQLHALHRLDIIALVLSLLLSTEYVLRRLEATRGRVSVRASVG